MDFYNAYSQGFARVAACTHQTVIGEEALLQMALD